MNWAMARREGWRVVLRIDDLDGPRVRAGAADEAIDTLRWLGLDWDEGPVYQTSRVAEHRAALERLILQGDAYPCRCTRSQLLAGSLSAPHAGDHELRYAGHCRPPAGAKADPRSIGDPDVAWRLRTPDEPVPFHDDFAGPSSAWPQREVGDFLVATKGGAASYQLATVVDDSAAGIDRVVRGDDLLASTARQALLYQRLGLGRPPRTAHLPLVVGTDGRRLAKRHGDTRVAAYRRHGAPAERIVGLVAAWCGVGSRRMLNAQKFAEAFSLARLPRDRVVFTDDDHRWLLGGAAAPGS